MALFPIFKRETVPDSSLTFNFDYEEPSRAYLKKMALETVIGFIAKSIAMSDFRFSKEGKRVVDDNHYAFNVRPNTDQSAFEFWFHFVYTMIHEGEVLVIWTDDGDLLIADSFDRKEYAVYPDVFSNVTVKDYTFQRTYRMDEVIYLKYGNEKLTDFMNGMFQDYTELFNRLIAVNLRANQIRAVVGIDASVSLDEKKQNDLQDFINRLFKSFREKSIAIIPKLKGFDYQEVAKGNETNASIEDLTKLKRSLIDEVADILSVPQALVHGDIADMDSLMKAYIKFCINPINKMIEDEMNAKIIGREDYLNGERLKVIGIQALNPLEMSEAVDKLIASMAYTPNEVRVKMGDEPSDDPRLDKHYITKNYQGIDSVGGGENNNET